MTNKISIVVPIYNREKYIGKCLDSLLNQTYKNLEIICVDDKSNDSSLKIVEEYSRKDDRIKIIALPENGGVSNARNTGITSATGDYLVFVDSDDTISENMMSEMLDVAVKTCSDIVLSDLCMFSDGNKKDMRISLEPLRIYDKSEIQSRILPRFTFDGADNLGLFAFSTKLYKKSIIKDNNIFFDPDIQYEEDKLFVIEALANCDRLYYIPKEYYIYNTSSGGLYSAFNENAWIWYVNGYKKFISLIEKYNIKNANKKYLSDAFIYNISWFLYRSVRMNKKGKSHSLQSSVINNSEVQKICSDIIDDLTSFDRRIANAILNKNRFLAIKLINFVYSGKKDKLFKILKRQ